MAGAMAQLCASCHSAGDSCIKCGQYLGGSGQMAQLCSNCASQSRDYCIKCGSSTGGSGAMAQVCSSCAGRCIKCGGSL
jgi:hypothetical protein